MRTAYSLYATLENKLRALQRIEEHLLFQDRHVQEAADVRWACILLEKSLAGLSRKIGKNAKKHEF